jgi:hypothetical protein
VPVVTVKDPVVDPLVTVTLAGALSADNPLALSVTTAPPAGAAFDSVTLQLLVAFAPSVVGLHWNDERTVAMARFKLTLWELPL